MHYVIVDAIVQTLGLAAQPARSVLDLGCGGGAAGAAWAFRLGGKASVTGVDAHRWALDEAAATYHAFGLRGRTVRARIGQAPLVENADAIVAGWVLNELDDDDRATVIGQLVAKASAGARVLIVEPISGRVSPWWSECAATFAAVNGRADEWRFPAVLPDLVARLDRAAGMRHDELTARSIAAGLLK